jgi:hypothetical protein
MFSSAFGTDGDQIAYPFFFRLKIFGPNLGAPLALAHQRPGSSVPGTKAPHGSQPLFEKDFSRTINSDSREVFPGFTKLPENRFSLFQNWSECFMARFYIRLTQERLSGV